MSQKQYLLIPGPVTVPQPVLEAAGRPMIDHRGPEFKRLLERLTHRMKPIFGTKNEVYFLGSSGTGGLECAVGNMFGPGDRILACPVGVFGDRIIAIAKKFGCEVEVLETEWGRGVDASKLANRLREDAKGEIKGILLTHNETSTGVENDMAALAAAIGKHPALTIVDSVSGMAASPFHMDDWNFDIVVAASQKALMAPPGVAMVAISERGWQKIEKNHTQRYYFDLRAAREFAKIGQTPWTPPVSIFFALDRALDLFERDTAKAVHARHHTYASAIRKAGEAMGLRVFSHEPHHSATVVALHVPAGIEAAKVIEKMHQSGYVISGGQVQLKGKIFRIGTMGDITKDTIMGVCGALEYALGAQGFNVDVGAAASAARIELGHLAHAAPVAAHH